MIRRLLFVFFLFLMTYSSLNAHEVNGRPLSLIPYPATVLEGEGTFVFTEKTTMALEDKNLETIAKEFVGLFAKPAGLLRNLRSEERKERCSSRKMIPFKRKAMS